MPPQVTIGIQEIDRKYEILGKMGEGGMGEIYKVRHRLLDEVRVIKTIHTRHRESEELQARFLREAKVATQLRHPNIAALHDFTVGEDGTACIVMEFIQGTDLAALLKSDDTLTLGEALEVARQTLDALAYLHRKQIVHRDVSPDNVMLTRDEAGQPHAKLIDLGIAKSLSASHWQTRTGLFVGKVKYASPEQLGATQSTDVDSRSDLYSLGVVLYQLLTREFPISGADEASIIAGHLFRPPRAFEETDPEGRIPPALRSVVLKSLAKDPAERYSTAEEFTAALEAGAQGMDLAAFAPSGPRATMAPAATPSGGAATAAIAAAPTVAVTRPGRPRRQEAEAAAAATRPGTRRWWLAAAVAVLLAAVTAVAVWRPDLAGRIRGAAAGPDSAAPELDRAAVAGLDFGPYRAVVIGNDAYGKLPPLQTAGNDAHDLGELLRSKYGFDVKVLTDATRHDIITALSDVGAALTGEDNLLIYYAGHGRLDEHQSGYWQPVDADPFNTSNWISTKYEVSAVLSGMAARHILVIADSCYSGTLLEPTGLRPRRPPGRLGPPPRRLGPGQVRDLLARRSRLALTSGGLSPVLDQGDGHHSIFAKALLAALGNSRGVVAVSQVFDRLRDTVPLAARQFGVEQDPLLAPIARAGDEGGQFFFVPASG